MQSKKYFLIVLVIMQWMIYSKELDESSYFSKSEQIELNLIDLDELDELNHNKMEYVYLPEEVKEIINELKEKNKEKNKENEIFRESCEYITSTRILQKEVVQELIKECWHKLEEEGENKIRQQRILEGYQIDIEKGNGDIKMEDGEIGGETKGKKKKVICNLLVNDCLKVGCRLIVCGEGCINKLKVNELTVDGKSVVVDARNVGNGEGKVFRNATIEPNPGKVLNLRTLKSGSSQVVISTSGDEVVLSLVGVGDVVGPSGATPDAIAIFDGPSGKIIKDSGITISSGVISCVDRIEVEDGTAAAPSYTFCDDPSMGLYRSGDDELSISTGGSQRVVVDSSGNVGIGTATPSEQLEITQNMEIPDTSSSSVGVIQKNGTRFIHNFGTDNTFLGKNAGNFTMTGSHNTADGVNALSSIAFGNFNTAVGENSLSDNTSGSFNTAVGYNALNSDTTGSSNTALGERAGSNQTTGSNNIYIGTNATGTAGESTTIRIGSFGFTSTGRCFIAGIHGVSGAGNLVQVDANGQLTDSTASSIRYKEEVEDMGNLTEDLVKLRPVKFKYKPEINSSGETQYGLIAEEVAEVYPDLVGYKDNQPESVKYHLLSIFLLNEVKKLMFKQKEREEKIKEQENQFLEFQKELDYLKSKLSEMNEKSSTSSSGK